MQRRKLPSCFLTRTTLDENGEWDGRITPLNSNSWICVQTSSIMADGTLLYFCLNGVTSFSSIRCFTLSVVPRSVDLVENTSENAAIRSLHLCSSSSDMVVESLIFS